MGKRYAMGKKKKCLCRRETSECMKSVLIKLLMGLFFWSLGKILVLIHGFILLYSDLEMPPLSTPPPDLRAVPLLLCFSSSVHL